MPHTSSPPAGEVVFFPPLARLSSAQRGLAKGLLLRIGAALGFPAAPMSMEWSEFSTDASHQGLLNPQVVRNIHDMAAR
jgi:hypothetical protein